MIPRFYYEKIKLTDSQKKFAEENLIIVDKYLRRRRMSKDIYYSIAIKGYLLAVVKYDLREDLKKYKFSTIAWNSMRSAIGNYHGYLKRPMRYPPPASINYTPPDSSEEILCLIPAKDDLEQIIEEKLLWENINSVLNNQELSLLKMRLDKYEDKEISDTLNLSDEEMKSSLIGIWEKIRSFFSFEMTLQ